MVPERSFPIQSNPQTVTAIDGAILDLDGTVYRGSTVIPGVPAGIISLERAGIPFTFVTNNATNAPATYEENLRAMDVPLGEGVLNSGAATAEHLTSTPTRPRSSG